MKTTIDAAGRVVVPKAFREAIGLRPGSQVEIRVSDGRLEMEPAPLEVRIEKRGGLIAACARRARADVILTWNPAHFERLTEDVEIASPAQQ